jgi:hypothetical protein
LARFIREIGALVFGKTSALIDPRVGRKQGGAKHADAAKQPRAAAAVALRPETTMLFASSRSTSIFSISQDGLAQDPDKT